jgi:hypothetical protein
MVEEDLQMVCLFRGKLCIMQVFLIPLLLSQKITEIYTKKIQQNAAYGGAFFLGLILGGIIFKMGGRAVIQQPISRRYELI